MDFVHKRRSLIEEKVFAAPSSKHSKHFSQSKFLPCCVNQGSSSLFSLILVFEEGISISSHGQDQVQRQLPGSDKDQQAPGKSMVTRQVQGQARKAVHWAWVQIRGVHGCSAAAMSLRWEHAGEHHPQRSSQGGTPVRLPGRAVGGESLLKLPPAFSGEASEPAEASQRAVLASWPCRQGGKLLVLTKEECMPEQKESN